MPELPEVERAAGELRRAIVGKTIARVSVLHPAQRRTLPPRAARALRGAAVEGVVRRGKHQLLELADGRTVHVHFRMAGDWEIDTVDVPVVPRARVVIDFTDGTRVSLVDPRALSTMSLHTVGQSPLPDLGPEPADPTLTPATLRVSLRSRRGPVKPVLLDQRIIAGIGNIYASEALWRARIDPRATAADLAPDRIRTLLAAIRYVLGAAAQLPGRYKDAARSRRIAVYGRAGQPCRRCHPDRTSRSGWAVDVLLSRLSGDLTSRCSVRTRFPLRSGPNRRGTELQQILAKSHEDTYIIG